MIQNCRMNREKLFGLGLEGYAFFEGGRETARYNTDRDNLFRQESTFYYLTAVTEGGFDLLVNFGEKRFTLIAPKLPEAYSVWLGPIASLNDIAEEYGFAKEDVIYGEDLPEKLAGIPKDTPLHVIKNFPPKINKETLSTVFSNFNEDVLEGIIAEMRLIKSPYEIEVLRKVCEIGSKAHTAVMKESARLIKEKGSLMEYELQATLLENYYKLGCRFTSFEAIVGGGKRSSILHYPHNNKEVQNGEMVLVDAGTELELMASDITRTFPVNGKFTEDQRLIYSIVLGMQSESNKKIAPGVEWRDVHRRAIEVLVDRLLEVGMIQGGTREELMEKHIGSYFMPHGLGHLMGLDVHDVGGYPKGREKILNRTYQYLRMNRILQPGMVMTNEPGIYFIGSLLLPVLEDEELGRYFNKEMVMKFMGFGGVRIEDDILITEEGKEILTSTPREIEDIERVMSEI